MPPTDNENSGIKDIEALVTLSEAQLTRLIQSVDERTLAVALRTASEEVKIAVFTALPGKASDPMNNTLGMIGRISFEELEAAQKEVVERANGVLGKVG